MKDAGGCPGASAALILCYHAIADHRGDRVLADYAIPQAQFEAQLASLEKRGFAFISGEDFLAALQSGVPLPHRAVLLSFDDCYADLLEVARKILQPRGIPAIAFAVTGMQSGTNEWDQAIGASRLRLLNWDELAELRMLGIELGSHSRNHRQMCGLSEDELVKETSGSADDLSRHLRHNPRLFAYPYGELDTRSRAAVEQAGYTAAFSLTEKRAGPGCDPFNLPRMEILRRDTPWRFWLKTTWPGLAKALRWRKFLARWKARFTGA